MKNETTYTYQCQQCGSPGGHKAPSIDSGFGIFRTTCKMCGYRFFLKYTAPGARVHEKSVDLQLAIYDVFDAIEPPMTVRQMYYQLTTRHAVEKTEAGYNRVQTTMTAMRRNGSIPYNWVSDNSRSFYRAPAYDDLHHALSHMHDFYRRDLWQDQPVHVEIWLEKRSLASQLTPVCNEFGVRLSPMGGFTSISFAYEAAMELREVDKPIHVYHLSDLDADGAYSSIALERELREHGADVEFHRLGLTPYQIVRYSIQDSARPQKRTSPRWNWWVDNYGADFPAYEIDALNPQDLRQLVRDAISSHIDPWQWENLKRIEKLERETIGNIMAGLGA